MMRNLVGLMSLRGNGGDLDDVALKLAKLGLQVPTFTMHDDGYNRIDSWNPNEDVDLLVYPYNLQRRG